MSPEIDRIPVPTNGKGPHRDDEPASSTDPPPPDQATPDQAPPPSDQAAVAFTPTQLAVGFGILASLVLLVAGRIRRRGRSRRGGFGRR